jgi:hypothetical protein
MSRPLAGIACRIRVPVRQYQAVALLVGERNHVIRLMHRDIGLSLDVEEFENYATAEEYRERLADFLGLPSVIAAGTPSPEDSLSNAKPGARRTRAVKARRPRFLTRRHAGHEITIRKVEGREIIARH